MVNENDFTPWNVTIVGPCIYNSTTPTPCGLCVRNRKMRLLWQPCHKVLFLYVLNECSALGWMNTTFLSPDCFIVFDHCPLQLSLAALDSIAHFRIVFHRWEKWMNNCSDAIMALLYTTVSTNLLHYEYLGQKQWWLRAILFLETQYCCQTKFYHLGA